MIDGIKSYLLIVLGWIGVVELFILIRYFGLEALPQFENADLSGLDRPWMLQMGLIVGVAIGTAYHLLDRFLDRPSIRRRPYGVMIGLQTAGNVAFVILALALVSEMEVMRGESESFLHSLGSRFGSINFIIVLIYITLASFLFSFLKQVDRKFGPGNLRKLIIGKYYHPKEEELIFMFLDLKGSTTHAERLGHVRFSKLIQDCFIDLSVVIDHAAQIYQYVGDEAILYWEVDAGLKNASCMRAYFEFADRLRDRAGYYRDTYGLEPEFKAGINIGSATVLEVGEIKREISYLGDVLNTAARIQGKCNDYGEELLVSEILVERLKTVPDDLDLQEIGEVELRGREAAVRIFSVRRRG